MTAWTEKDKKYEDECGLSHLKTNQQPLGNKNVLSVIVNYKYWSSPCCSLLIMLNGLPLTIMKPLTLCMCVRLCACVCERERQRERLYGCLFEEICYRFFMALKAPVPHSISLVGSQTSNLHVCCVSALLFLMSLAKIKTAKTEGRLNEGKVKMRFYKECWQKPV